MTRSRLLCLALCALAPGLLLAAPASADLAGFQSPSHKIGCYISGKGVRCDVRDRRWDPPPKPPSCELDWGNGLTVGRHGRAEYVCAGDTVLNQGPELGHGETISRGRFRCTSKQSAMRCVNRRSGHGFKLSKQRAKPF